MPSHGRACICFLGKVQSYNGLHWIGCGCGGNAGCRPGLGTDKFAHATHGSQSQLSHRWRTFSRRKHERYKYPATVPAKKNKIATAKLLSKGCDVSGDVNGLELPIYKNGQTMHVCRNIHTLSHCSPTRPFTFSETLFT